MKNSELQKLLARYPEDMDVCVKPQFTRPHAFPVTGVKERSHHCPNHISVLVLAFTNIIMYEILPNGH